MEKLRRLINEINSLEKFNWDDPHAEAWKNKVLRFLKREFGENSDFYKEFYDLTHGPYVVSAGTPNHVFQKEYIEDLEKYRIHLQSFLEEIEDEKPKVTSTTNMEKNVGMQNNRESMSREQKTIFIIHGHDDINTFKLQSLLKNRWKLNPKILQDEPGKGRTIIQKFEEEARKATYAFAILTPDDIVKGSQDDYRQSRPNVFFELGWFYGQLGREKVCILFSEGTKIHSDLEGISYIKFDKNISDKLEDIEKELWGAGIIRRYNQKR